MTKIIEGANKKKVPPQLCGERPSHKPITSCRSYISLLMELSCFVLLMHIAQNNVACFRKGTLRPKTILDYTVPLWYARVKKLNF